MPPFLAVLGLFMSGISAYGQFRAGQAQQEAKNREAGRLEHQKIQNEIKSIQNENIRRTNAATAVASNTTDFIYRGNTGKSFDAFMEANRQVVNDDVNNITYQRYVDNRLNLQAQETARSEGSAFYQAGILNASNTLATGYYNYRMTKIA